ncbi:Hsp70 family protein [bacterium]|nr:Hsp70 family protein [bacterium]
MSCFVGIDLGTTNTSVTYLDPETGSLTQYKIHQMISEGLMDARDILPSVLYTPADGEFSEGDLDLPWEKSPSWIVGEMARRQWSRAGHRVVHSAKSWLCHGALGGKDPILPFKSTIEDKVSAYEATLKIISHLKSSWNYDALHERVPARLEELDVVVTIPASFDPAARELTLEAAREAGLEKLRLLEEPQAALYSWLQDQSQDWRENLQVGNRILVCDVGGGTTDFSLIEAVDEEGHLALRRVAVGNHILLGGDNMDLALAHLLRARLEENEQKPDDLQFGSLLGQAREAKEEILSGSKEEVHVVLTGSGSSLFASSMETHLRREDLETVVLQGFFSPCELSDLPASSRAAGLREVGLAYAQDPSILKYLAQFLSQTLSGNGEDFPTTILFNGSMFQASLLQEKILSTLNSWSVANRGEEFQLLGGIEFPLAVSRGAAYYSWVSQGEGIRIKASLPYSYYIGVEKAQMAIPGMKPELSLVCTAPYGMEEGTSAHLDGELFYLVHGENVQFRLFRSPVRRDELGTRTDFTQDEFEEISCLEKELAADSQTEFVPVELESVATEIGTLEVWCQGAGATQEKWKLEFHVREQS